MRFEFRYAPGGMQTMSMIAEDEYDFILLRQRYSWVHGDMVTIALWNVPTINDFIADPGQKLNRGVQK